MRSGFARCLAILALSVSLPAFSQTAAPNSRDFPGNLHPTAKVPANVILVKGAWSSASDSTTAVPEGGSLTNNVFRNKYFGITCPLPRIGSRNTQGRLPQIADAMCWRRYGVRTPTEEMRGAIS